MHKVRVSVEIDEVRYRLYEAEARRRGTSVEELLGRCLDTLLREEQRRLDEEEDEHPIQTG